VHWQRCGKVWDLLLETLGTFRPWSWRISPPRPSFRLPSRLPPGRWASGLLTVWGESKRSRVLTH
jgi:hypothetical protein